MKTKDFILFVLSFFLLISIFIIKYHANIVKETKEKENVEYVEILSVAYEAPHKAYYENRFNDPESYLKMSYIDYVNLSNSALKTENEAVYDKIVNILSDIFDTQIEVLKTIDDPLKKSEYLSNINEELNLLHKVVDKSETKMIKALKKVSY